MKITERERRRLIEEFEWLEDHCWPRADLTITPPKRDNPDIVMHRPTAAKADKMVIYHGELVSCPAALPRLLFERAWDLAANSVAPGHA